MHNYHGSILINWVQEDQWTDLIKSDPRDAMNEDTQRGKKQLVF